MSRRSKGLRKNTFTKRTARDTSFFCSRLRPLTQISGGFDRTVQNQTIPIPTSPTHPPLCLFSTGSLMPFFLFFLCCSWAPPSERAGAGCPSAPDRNACGGFPAPAHRGERPSPTVTIATTTATRKPTLVHSYFREKAARFSTRSPSSSSPSVFTHCCRGTAPSTPTVVRTGGRATCADLLVQLVPFWSTTVGPFFIFYKSGISSETESGFSLPSPRALDVFFSKGQTRFLLSCLLSSEV